MFTLLPFFFLVCFRRLFPSQPLCLGNLSCVSSPGVPSLCPSATPRFSFDNFPYVLVSQSRGAMTCTPDIPPCFGTRICSSASIFSLYSSFILGSSSFLRHGTATTISKLLRSHLSLASFLRNSSRQPHAVSISRDDLRRRRYDTQVDAILPHARQFPERSSWLASFSTGFLQQMPCLVLLLICPAVSRTRSSHLGRSRNSSTRIPRVLRSTAKWNASHQSSLSTVLRCRCRFQCDLEPTRQSQKLSHVVLCASEVYT